VCSAYIEVFRNTPLLVQLYLIYFGLPEIGLNLNPTWAGLVALTLNNAAYTAEIYRAGFDSVPKGLIEAGRALGMRQPQVFRHIMFVPATRTVFPALTNQFILLFLASSIASIIGLPELMNTILNINSETYRTFEVLAVGGLLYFVASGLFALAARVLEGRLFGWAVKSHA
jgi:polar amino acid transport system permease protein